jgi:glycosyltransferase involved in cell wall biosynthesis
MKHLDTKRSENLVDLTLVIPAFNEEVRIGRCLSSALASELPNDCRWRDLVVLDGASTDDTVGEVGRWSRSNVPVTIVTSHRRSGKAAALGAFHKRLLLEGRSNELVIICDADVVVLPGSLKALLEPLVKDFDLGVVWGCDTPDDCRIGRWASSFQMVATTAFAKTNGAYASRAYGRFFAYRVRNMEEFS